MSLKVQWTVASGAALLLLLSIGVLSYRRLEQEDAAQQWVSHTHRVMEKLEATLANSLELDAAHAGNALAGPDSETVQELEANLADIKSLTADNRRQQDALRQLTSLVHARNAVHASSADATAAARSRELLDQIKRVLLGMRQEEEHLEGERIEQVRRESRMARTVLGIGYTTALVMLALTGVSVLREMVRRTRSEEQLQIAQKQFRLLFESNPFPFGSTISRPWPSWTSTPPLSSVMVFPAESSCASR
jgi:CHASE3 domain sensor protein